MEGAVVPQQQPHGIRGQVLREGKILLSSCRRPRFSFAILHLVLLSDIISKNSSSNIATISNKINKMFFHLRHQVYFSCLSGWFSATNHRGQSRCLLSLLWPWVSVCALGSENGLSKEANVHYVQIFTDIFMSLHESSGQRI